MKIRPYHFLLFALMISFYSASAQKGKPQKQGLSQEEQKAAKKDAATLFSTTDYRGALSAYLDLYNADPQNVEYNYRLGYCYLVTTFNRRAAMKHLEFAVQSKKDVKNDWFFYLGMAYMYNEKWDEAVESLTKFKNDPKSKPIKDFPNTDRLIEMSKNGKELSANPVNCTITNVGKMVNSPFEDFNPCISSDGQNLYFASRRKGTAGIFNEEIGVYTADVYTTSWKDSSWSKIKNLGPNINSTFDDEIVGISPAGDQLLLYFDNQVVYADIGVSTLKGKMWQKPLMLPSPINTKEEEYSACFSPDLSTVYFSSKRKDGGLGGKDLWMCKRENGIWGKVVNMGSDINTQYDEKNPFITLDGKRLYFSSKGWNSMGDFDIFCSTWNEASGKWSKPVNVGFPINDADDNSWISFTGDNRFAYIAAVKPSGSGDKDIYKVEFLDTLNHPFSYVVKGQLSGSGSKLDVRKVTVENTSTGLKRDVRAEGINTQFIFAGDPGTYILSVMAKGYKASSDTIVIGNEFPPMPVLSTIKLQSSK